MSHARLRYRSLRAGIFLIVQFNKEDSDGLPIRIQRVRPSSSGEWEQQLEHRSPPSPPSPASRDAPPPLDEHLGRVDKRPLEAPDDPATRPGRLRALMLPGAHASDVVAAAPGVPPRELVRRFWPFARPYRAAILAGLVLVALLPAVQAAEIWLFKVAVDEIIVPGDLGQLPAIAGIVVALTFVGAALSFGEDYAWTWAGERFLLDLRAKFFSHLQTLSFDTLDRRRLGDLVARMGGDIQAIETFVLGGLGEVVSAFARIGFFAGALFLLDPQLALYALALAPPFYLAARYFARLARHAAREKRRRSGALSAVAEESLANTALVQSSNRSEDERRRLLREGEGVVDAELSATRIGGAFSGAVAVIEVTAVLAVVGFGTWAIQEGRLTVGGLLAFMAYLTQLLRPVGDLSHLASSLLSAAAGGERVLELLDKEPLVRDRHGASTLKRPTGRIELENVTFRYPGAHDSAVENLTLRIEPGEVVALTGPSGAGKSTVARLLVRFADPDAGSVRIDGHDVRDVTVASVRDNVGILLQETMLFDASVADNIRFARPDAPAEAVEAAVRAAGVRDFLASLPDGYETRVGQRGRALSGGQRRRIEIARTLLRDTPVVVLDEPTTGLDAEGAGHLMGPLRALLEGRTALIITHDPALLARADRVVRIGGVLEAPAGVAA
jgi:ATP-binding cassette, subfamily B, bacterial